MRLRAAEREGGGVAVEVLGAGEIAGRDPRGLEPADPSDLGAPVRGRESPSMLAFTYRAQPGTTARALSLQVARYTPQAVLIASIEEARYDVLLDEEGKALVRARYAVPTTSGRFSPSGCRTARRCGAPPSPAGRCGRASIRTAPCW